MIFIGYSLVSLELNEEIQFTSSLPWRVKINADICDFDQVGQIMPNSEAPTHKVVERVLSDSPPPGPCTIISENTQFDGVQVIVYRSYEVQPPQRRLIDKALILERLTDAQLDAAVSLMTNRQKERWRMPGHPSLYADDSELLGLLAAINADPAVVLAE